MFRAVIPLKVKESVYNQKITTWQDVRSKLGDKLGDRLGQNEWGILEILWQDQSASITEIAQKLKISNTAVENNIAKLKKKGLLERVGSNKKGHWKVVLEG